MYRFYALLKLLGFKNSRFSFTKFVKNFFLNAKFNDYIEFLYLFNRRLLSNSLNRKSYLFGTINHSYKSSTSVNPGSNVIWQYWDNGYENSPLIVKACMSSVKANANGYEHIILNDSSLKDYLTLPQHIMNKYKSGVINKTHFSEIVRISLLAEYGGIWLDATILLTDQISNMFKTNSKYLFVRVPNSDIFGPKEILFNTWILSSPVNSEYFNRLKSFFYNYWLQEKKQIDYFICDLAMKQIFDSFLTHRERNEINEAASSLNIIDCHNLQFLLTHEFSQNKLNKLLQRSPVHKLTFYFATNATRPYPGKDFLNWVLGEADDLSTKLPSR